MHKLVSKLIIYRNIGEDSILFHLAAICREFESGSYKKEDLTARILEEIHRLLDVATTYGFNHNLWRSYLAFLLAMTETPFTLVAEKKGIVDGTVNEFARNDFAIFRQLLDYDFSLIEEELELNCFTLIRNYRSVEKKEQLYNRNVSIRIQELSEAIEATSDAEELFRVVMEFYKKYGVGQFGLNKAFRVNTTDPSSPADGSYKDRLIVPITITSNVVLDDLVGYELQKTQLMKNTEAFLEGKPANNVLLYGDAGTGKSTSIKALLNLYYEQGLRMIEVYKHEFRYLRDIISIIKGRNYRFIIYMDDLSFEGAETEYKYLKAVIEGDLEVKPDNVLIYATSNRRHLLRETFNDRKEIEEDDVHPVDTMAERRSLSDRFGVTIGYFKPDRQEYYDIVKGLAEKAPEIDLPEEELLHQADIWEIRHGGRSGRTARQFIDYLLGN
ncbi:MAG: ATP-binding protein [Parasporobacterium sp.]|nr:ATP-binding protein [Parasporobacterium sp.]